MAEMKQLTQLKPTRHVTTKELYTLRKFLAQQRAELKSCRLGDDNSFYGSVSRPACSTLDSYWSRLSSDGRQTHGRTQSSGKGGVEYF